MVAKIYTDDFLANADRLKDEFGSLKDLAAHLGVNADELSKNLRRHGYTVKKSNHWIHPRRIDIDLDTIVDLNCAGNSVAAIARRFGVAPSVIRRIMKGGGITPIKDFYNFTDEDIINMFSEGYSVLRIANHFNVARTLIVSRLEKHGIKPRSGSQANIIRFSKCSENDLKKITEKARNVRMRNLFDGGTDQDSPSIGLGEAEVKNALINYALDFQEQVECGPYALDFRVGNVAVEIKYHLGKATYSANPKRSKYIRDSKMGLIYIVHAGLDFLTPSLPYIVPIIDKLSRDPSFIGQERVIRCRAYNGLSRFKGNYVSPVVVTPDFMATIHQID